MSVIDPLLFAQSRLLCAHPCFLDSAIGGGASHVLHDPEAVYRCKDGLGEIRWRGGRQETVPGDPFRALDLLLKEHPHLFGAGYWSYDLRYHLESLPRLCRDDLELPDCWVGLYPTDHIHRFPSTVRSTANPLSDSGSLDTLPGLDDSISRDDYEAAVRTVLDYIAAGDCYQVNLSHRLCVPYSGQAWELYRRLRELSPAPYAAFLDCGDHQVVSSSPELFLRVSEGCVETRPIKGTRPRGSTAEEDARLASELQTSTKDRAELLMIVDLERNDLGRVCEYGSVEVTRLFELETYANVHHLVATVRGRLRPEVTPLECLRATFPGGSITGAPKIRAMEIIEELEPVRRGIYTGAIGWVDGHGHGEWNIAIRTLVLTQGRACFHVGGGIVADSQPAAEYEETLTKARGMLRALNPSP